MQIARDEFKPLPRSLSQIQAKVVGGSASLVVGFLRPDFDIMHGGAGF